MGDVQKWIAWMKKLPVWVQGVIGLIAAIVSFVILFRENYHLGLVITGLTILVSVLCLSAYIAFAKTPPLIIGGKGVYRCENYRIWALRSIAFIVVGIGLMLLLRPSRLYITTAFVGTATPTVVCPFQPEAENEILVTIAPFDGNENIYPETRIERNLKQAIETISELSSVRVERYPEVLKEANHTSTLEQIKKTCRPSIIIWGWYDKLGITANYEIVEFQKLNHTLYKPSLEEVLRLESDLDRFTFYVTRELPEEVTHLTFFTIGQIYIIRDKMDKARIYLNRAVTSFPNHYRGTWREDQFLLNLATVQILGLDDFESGIKIANCLIAKNPGDLNGYGLRAQSFELMAVSEYIERNDISFNFSIELFDGEEIVVVSADKDIPLEAFKNSESLKSYNDAVENTTCVIPELYYQRGIQNYYFGNIEKAIYDVQIVATVMQPGFTRNLAEALIEEWSSEVGKPISTLIEPQSAYDYWQLGLVYGKVCDFEKAVESYSTAIEIDQAFVDAYLSRGGNYSDSGKYELALRDYEKVMQLEPDNSLVYHYRGTTYRRQNNIEDAIADFEHALELENDPEWRTWIEQQLYELQQNDSEDDVEEVDVPMSCLNYEQSW